MSKTNLIRVLVLVVAIAGLLGVPRKSDAFPSTSVSVGIFCISLGHQRVECHATASGGTAPYTFQWTPPQSTGGTTGGENQEVIAIIRCARAYSLQTVYVTATDSTGATDTASTTCFCGDAQ